ncbi:MAG: radical SAM protein [Cyclobacteriaceae bacterium]|nr:radical SAM protein [Cyclobacteriaceae bacterium]
MMGKNKLVRAFKTNGKYVWDIYNPAWPSKAFNSFFINHLHELEYISDEHMSLRRLLIAITKRCPLKCEHCSEGATLYNQDVLSYDDIISRIDPFIKKNVGQLVYSGGEPLSRFEDLVKLITRYNNKCDQWIYTSAYGLTIEKAKLLKKAGLNGAAISLDHHIEEEHNQFRGNQKSYYWVLEGIKNLQEVGIFVAINICPTKEYIDSNSVEIFISLAQELDVPIVNILEPRGVGNYQDKDVELEIKHKESLERISKKYNFNPAFFDSPTVIYPAAYRKMMPCGGGKSYLFLDYDGNLYPCPFCKAKMTLPTSDTELCEAE